MPTFDMAMLIPLMACVSLIYIGWIIDYHKKVASRNAERPGVQSFEAETLYDDDNDTNIDINRRKTIILG